MPVHNAVKKIYHFTTGLVRQPDKSGIENVDNIRDNNEFDVTFFLTSSGERKEEHLLLIVNGFDQMDLAHYHKDDQRENSKKVVGLCRDFVDRGIASVLIPIPNHMNRWPKTVPYPFPKPKPSSLVAAYPDRFYEGFLQELADLEKMADLILDPASRDRETFEDGTTFALHFDGNTRVHLVGYSIGGLATLSTFLKSDLEKKPRYNSCTLLSSGANFQSLHPQEIIGIDEATWKRIKYHFLGLTYKQKATAGIENDIFEMVLLGEDKSRFYDCVSELSNRILIVVGALDDVSSPRSVFELEPEETGLAVLKVPYLSHPLHSREWNLWNDWILDCVASFVKTHPKEVTKGKWFWAARTKRKLFDSIKSMPPRAIERLKELLQRPKEDTPNGSQSSEK